MPQSYVKIIAGISYVSKSYMSGFLQRINPFKSMKPLGTPPKLCENYTQGKICIYKLCVKVVYELKVRLKSHHGASYIHKLCDKKKSCINYVSIS